MFELWTEAVRSIEPMVKPAHRDLWLRPIECMGISDGRIHLRAPNRYHKEWFEDNFLPPILRDLETRAQRTFVVDFEVLEDQPAVVAALPVLPLPQQPTPRRNRGVPVPAPHVVTSSTFEKFVV